MKKCNQLCMYLAVTGYTQLPTLFHIGHYVSLIFCRSHINVMFTYTKKCFSVHVFAVNRLCKSAA